MDPRWRNVENLGKKFATLPVGGIIDRSRFKADFQSTVIGSANPAF